MIKAYLISTGTELLLGSTMDTNSVFLSRQLAEIGIKVIGKSIVGDNHDAIAAALQMGLSSADIIITTGGMGPTLDDLTKEIACETAGFEMQLVPEEEQRLREFFKKRNRPMPEINLKQAMFPPQATILANPRGTAPGMYLPVNGKVIICMPGPPRETEPMYMDHVKALLSRDFDLNAQTSHSRVVKILGPGESQVEEMISDVIKNARNYNLALLARDGEIDVRVTAEDTTHNDGQVLVDDIVDRISKALGDSVFGYDDDTLVGVVARHLQKNNLTISAAESCTGGLLGKMITDLPGSSAFFWGGVVTYSNDAKQRLLQVSEQTLTQFGAVSRETALEMAQGIRQLSQTDYGLAITGIAGPEGGTKDKPVGLVYIAIAGARVEQVRELHFVGSREAIRVLSAKSVLDLLRKQMLRGEG